MIKAILEFILILFFLRFIFNFVLPLLSMNKRKDNYDDSSSNQKRKSETQYKSTNKTEKEHDSKKKDLGEYIEFEEIKDKK